MQGRDRGEEKGGMKLSELRRLAREHLAKIVSWREKGSNAYRCALLLSVCVVENIARKFLNRTSKMDEAGVVTLMRPRSSTLKASSLLPPFCQYRLSNAPALK